MIDAIKKRNGVVEFKVYANEGHGFSRVENQIDAYQRVSGTGRIESARASSGLQLLGERVDCLILDVTLIGRQATKNLARGDRNAVERPSARISTLRARSFTRLKPGSG